MATNVALVTGASSGIGEAFAKMLAKSGHDLVLVARRHDRLQSLADSLAREHGVSAWAEAFDLSDPEAPSAIFERTRELGVDIDVLVNNAGALLQGRYLDYSWDEQAANLRLMAIAPCELMHLFLGPMVARRRGAILNVTSLSVTFPATPGVTFYAPTKSLLLKTTRGLAWEYRYSGVTIAAISPGVTSTELTNDNGVAELLSRLPGSLLSTSDQVAAAGLRLLERRGVHSYAGRFNSVLSYPLERLLPHGVLTRLLAKWMMPEGCPRTVPFAGD